MSESYLPRRKDIEAKLDKDHMADSNDATQEVKAYRVTYYECECPFCEVEVRVADDSGMSGASFTQECTECGKSFPARCE